MGKELYRVYFREVLCDIGTIGLDPCYSLHYVDIFVSLDDMNSNLTFFSDYLSTFNDEVVRRNDNSEGCKCDFWGVDKSSGIRKRYTLEGWKKCEGVGLSHSGTVFFKKDISHPKTVEYSGWFPCYDYIDDKISRFLYYVNCGFNCRLKRVDGTFIEFLDDSGNVVETFMSGKVFDPTDDSDRDFILLNEKAELNKIIKVSG